MPQKTTRSLASWINEAGVSPGFRYILFYSLLTDIPNG